MAEILPEWDLVRVFLAVARGGSLLSASGALGCDVSTVSRRLDWLEEAIGGPLFDRSREGARKTLLAESLLPHAEEMELSAARFSAQGAQVETEPVGVVRVSVMPGVADHFVAPGLVALRRRFPRLTVELDAQVAYADLTRREADLAIRTRRPGSGDLVAVHLLSARSVLLAAPRLSARLPRLGSTAALASLPFITWGGDLSHLAGARWLREHAPSAEVVLRTSHFPSQLAAARAGLGVVIAASQFAQKGLVELPHGRALRASFEALPVEDLWLVGHRALRHVPRVKVVWEHLKQTLTEAAAEGPSTAREAD